MRRLFQSSIENRQSASLRATWIAGAMVAILAGLAGIRSYASASDDRGDSSVPAAAPSPIGPLATISSDALFQELISHNQWRQDHLKAYSVKRVYRVTNGKGALNAEEHVSLEFEAPGIKTYTITSEKGSAAVRRLVFKKLLDSEVETAGGRSRTDSSISPSNYQFQLVGEEQLDNRPCYVVEATPTRKAKYLFRGKVWIDSQDFAVAKIDGEPDANPSWWTKRIHFVRRYQKIGDFWLPRSDESVNQVRIFGTHVLTVEHQDYMVTPAGSILGQQGEIRNQKVEIRKGRPLGSDFYFLISDFRFLNLPLVPAAPRGQS